MHALAIALFILGLSPPRDESELRYRVEIALSIAETDASEHEARLLASIARWESGFQPKVAACRNTRAVTVSLWQVKARNAAERTKLCESLTQAASVALARVRESLLVCGDLTGYVSGKCGRGKREAALRWVD